MLLRDARARAAPVNGDGLISIGDPSPSWRRAASSPAGASSKLSLSTSAADTSAGDDGCPAASRCGFRHSASTAAAWRCR